MDYKKTVEKYGLGDKKRLAKAVLGDKKTAWFFAYGSQIWKPNFKVTEKMNATLQNHHRAFCVLSTTYRGTEEKAGLVLGLMEGGRCHGVAYKVDLNSLTEIFEQEILRGTYIPTWTKAIDTNATEVTQEIDVIALVADPEHERTVSKTVQEQAQMIFEAKGERGTCLEYFENTFSVMNENGVHDSSLQAVSHFINKLKEAAEKKKETEK